jgi:hypothetical protein
MATMLQSLSAILSLNLESLVLQRPVWTSHPVACLTSRPGLFGSVVAVAFQIAFRVKMHVNDVFLFFLKSFLTSVHQNDLKTLKTY